MGLHYLKTTELTAAQRADKYRLYVEAVQNPAADVRFFSALYEQMNGRPPQTIREDFCGTAAISCEWIRSCDSARAVGVDVDAEALHWCREQRLSEMTPEEARRLELIHADVLDASTPSVDVILAPNTSICLLKKRPQLIQYLSHCRGSLNSGGLVVIDIYAGPEAQRTGEDRIKQDNFVCIWEQAEFNAVTNEALNRIHFVFADGSRITDAFVYDMRMWMPAELCDGLLESGFHGPSVYRRVEVTAASVDCSILPCQDAEIRDHWDVYVVGFTNSP
ncbi:MAG: class I SAM-dependent methyltransferase [Planctomycetes bacterium]|nr:class I SAM-dependent methyltransferase [Planctomycetota bacterium]